AAYEELYAQDWIETLPRRGVMVSQHLPEIKPRTFRPEKIKRSYQAEPSFDYKKISPVNRPSMTSGNYRLAINDGFPDARVAPLDLLSREYRRLFDKANSSALSMYADNAGSTRLRTAIAGFLSGTRGLSIGTEHVLISRGAQMAIYLAAALLIKPGDTVIVAEPNYRMANMIFEQFGAKLLRVPADENGINIEAVERLCRKAKPALLYVIPHHHHPTTVTLSAERRMKLLQLIEAYNLPVIEDDYDYDFHYNHNPILPLASAGHSGNVIYIGSLTKFLAPSVRVGYMAAPEAFIRQASQLKMMIDIRGDILLEEALATLSNAGHIQRHLKKSVKLYHHRRDIFCDLLDEELGGIVSFVKPQGGMAVWVAFDKKYPLPLIAQRAARKGLYMSDGSTYNSGVIHYNSLRMGYASLEESEMLEVIKIIKKSL
ncbi:MAG TPA: PLP-dependent aminotransferase family protein, partial [Chitinophagaceae bacterium]|nr:PLP-dependent aminotransferase family protein [Chitinophagaceae bacterium]